jgi:hypothetical protein
MARSRSKAIRRLPIWQPRSPFLGRVLILPVIFCCAILYVMIEPTSECSILSWNVRGLNSQAKREDVKQVIQLHKPSIVYLQETKLVSFTDSIVSQCLGAGYADSYQFKKQYTGLLGPTGRKIKKLGIMFTFWWILWKVHNRSFFLIFLKEMTGALPIIKIE